MIRCTVSVKNEISVQTIHLKTILLTSEKNIDGLKIHFLQIFGPIFAENISYKVSCIGSVVYRINIVSVKLGGTQP